MKMLVKTKVSKEMERKSALIWKRSRMQSAQLMKKFDNIYKLNEFQIRAIADDIAGQVKKSTHAIHVEDNSGYGRDWNYGNAWL